MYDQVYSFAPYHSAVGDLNDDGRMDLVIGDDNEDVYLLNEGNHPSGKAEFAPVFFPPKTDVINVGNVVIEDLDRDGWNDVIMADVDITLPGCDHQAFIFHNSCDPPDVSFQVEGEVIPDDMLTGVHDVAVFDIDNNGWLDLVIGRCTGTQIWMNSPPCLADLDGSGYVGIADMLAMLSAWGPCPDCPEDLDGDGTVGVADLLALLSVWGPCP